MQEPPKKMAIMIEDGQVDRYNLTVPVVLLNCNAYF